MHLCTSHSVQRVEFVGVPTLDLPDHAVNQGESGHTEGGPQHPAQLPCPATGEQGRGLCKEEPGSQCQCTEVDMRDGSVGGLVGPTAKSREAAGRLSPREGRGRASAGLSLRWWPP